MDTGLFCKFRYESVFLLEGQKRIWFLLKGRRQIRFFWLAVYGFGLCWRAGYGSGFSRGSDKNLIFAEGWDEFFRRFEYRPAFLLGRIRIQILLKSRTRIWLFERIVNDLVFRYRVRYGSNFSGRSDTVAVFCCGVGYKPFFFLEDRLRVRFFFF